MMSASTIVKFWALINNTMRRVSADPNDTLIDLFESSQDRNHIPASLEYEHCTFFKLKKPVLMDNQDDTLDGDVFLEQALQACVQEGNRLRVEPRSTKIHRLGKNISRDFAYLVINFPDPFVKSNKAIADIRIRFTVLFKCLHITVQDQNNWTQADVEQNLSGGEIFEDIEGHPEFRSIQVALEKRRTYKVDNTPNHDLECALRYPIQFNRFFELVSDTEESTVEVNREFVTFSNALRCFHKDVSGIAGDASSYLKASNFTVYLIQPPFFSERPEYDTFKFQVEKLWTFPIFMDIESSPDASRKYTPKSDWMVISQSHGIPFVISEVVSNKTESDRNRMLIQATALARIGQFLMKPRSDRRFFVVAVYIDRNMVASRYIVLQTDSGTANNRNPVSIHQRDFRLKVMGDMVDFLREMYNLTTEITILSRELDGRKKMDLSNVKDSAKDVLSYSTKTFKTKTVHNTVMNPLTEGGEGEGEPEGEEGLGAFAADDIQNVLRQMNYSIDYIPHGHPQLAVIVNQTRDRHGYLKFVEREGEIKILKYLCQIRSPLNHTITNVQFWPVRGGTVISMPVAGGWLTSLKNPDEHLWSMAWQLFEAVAFMHTHNVAHMDIKPQNVIVPLTGGHLSIIDFSTSIRVRGPNVTYRGVVGTEDYMAPEIRKGDFKPMLADLWSCGKTLEELCWHCSASAKRTKLLDIAERLMDPNPEARPKMATVLEWMASAQQEQEDVELSAFRIVSPASTLCA